MNKLNPIYTEKTQCQDCFKCVRTCPVKTINVSDGSAQVVYDECILCGQCVGVCPVNAKKVRRDTGRARQLLKNREKTVVSLAPSFAAQFSELGGEREIIALCRDLGFYGVSETALGAQEITANLARMVRGGNRRGVLISSACPVLVDLIAREYPQYIDNVSPLLSPMLAHGRLLKSVYGPKTGVVFVGPCIAKKREADRNPGCVDLALSFREFREWLQEDGLLSGKTRRRVGDGDVFIPAPAHDGRLYPIDGGMAECLCAQFAPEERTGIRAMAFSGITQVKKALKSIERLDDGRHGTVFLELLACEGGCVNGPMAENDEATVIKRLDILGRHDGVYDVRPDGACIPAEAKWTASARGAATVEPDTMERTLHSIGKFTQGDELNCGACGYDSCRDFARAMLAGKAERNMCVSYMRKLAQKKALALMAAMPSGVVIVNSDLKIVESNMRFAQILGKETEELYETIGSLENAFVEKITPFADMFEEIFECGAELMERNVNAGDKVLKVTVFLIEKGSLAGGVVQDITAPAKYKQEIIRKSQQVIKNKIETVQKVAYLLGNNAAESEVLLSSVIDLFAREGMGTDERK